MSGALKVAVSIYDANNVTTPLVTNANIGNVNQSKNYDWTLSTAEAALIPASAYAHLAIGFSAPSAKSTDSLQVDGIAIDTLDLSAVGLLTVKGPLYINSQLSSAVRLTGQKTATKLSIINGGDFKILSPGACSGCNHTTVACTACTWASGTQPWTSYTTSIPDPLRSLPAPDPATLGDGQLQRERRLFAGCVLVDASRGPRTRRCNRASTTCRTACRSREPRR